MKTYRTRIQARKRNAIGIFEWFIYDCQAIDEETARNEAFNHFQNAGFETMGIVTRELIDITKKGE